MNLICFDGFIANPVAEVIEEETPAILENTTIKLIFLGVILVIAASIFLFIWRQKRKKKKLEQHTAEINARIKAKKEEEDNNLVTYIKSLTADYAEPEQPEYDIKAKTYEVSSESYVDYDGLPADLFWNKKEAPKEVKTTRHSVSTSEKEKDTDNGPSFVKETINVQEKPVVDNSSSGDDEDYRPAFLEGGFY